MWAALKKLLVIIPLMFVLAMIYLLICFSYAGMVELQLVMWGVDKTLALGISLGVAVGIYAFVILNHKIRNFIDDRRHE